MTFRHKGRKYRIALRLAVVASIQKEGEANPAYREVGAKAAICNPTDAFDIKYGARLALTRALKQAFPSSYDRALIWDQVLEKVNSKAQEIFDDASIANLARRFVLPFRRVRISTEGGNKSLQRAA